MNVTIQRASPAETPIVSAILLEAAQWLQQRGSRMWKDGELSEAMISLDVANGLFFLATCDGASAGIIKFQLEDRLFWPDVPQEDAAYVHRLAVRRSFGGGTVSQAMLNWAADRARGLGRKFLRLDCEASRPRLRAVYERFGFLHHSDRQVGPYFVSRYEYTLEQNPKSEI